MPGLQYSQSGAPRNSNLDRVVGINLDGASDRPRASTGGSHRGSVSGSHAGSRPGSQAGSPRSSSQGQPSATGGKGGFKATPLGYDPGRDTQELSPTELIGKRVDLPADAYMDNSDKHRFTARPGYNTQGKPIQISLNVFPVTEFRDQVIYQYDVSVTPNPKDSRALVKKVWNSAVVQEFIHKTGGMWLYDGNKLAWSSKTIPKNEARLAVDLDAGKPNKKKVGSSGVYYVHIRQATVVKLNYLYEYLKGNVGWDNHVLEGMNFFDHCMRQSSSEKMIQIRRNFYPKGNDGVPLDAIVEVHRGYYAAARLSESKKLMINVDTANTAFWIQCTLAEMALRLCNAAKPQVWGGYKQNRSSYVQSEAFRLLKKMWKLKFVVQHRGKMNEEKTYTIKRIMFDPNYGREGAVSRKVTFMKKLPDGSTRETTVWDHYREAYNFRLQYPNLPIIESTRGGLFPMELCNVAEYQRYPFKLDPAQTALMIKQAVTRPKLRMADITKGFAHLNFTRDPYLAEFGVRVSSAMSVTNARLLANPEVTFGANSKINPRMNGRWDLRGKQFVEPNRKPITSWGFVVCGTSCDKQAAEAFASKFTQTYRGHGGNIQATAHVMQIPYNAGDYGVICKEAWTAIGNRFKSFPQMIFFIVPDKNTLVYERIKKNMDCRFCCLSQVMVGSQVKKLSGQYMSNVAMKVNAKLGGVTCKVAGPNPNPPFFKEPTMMIGVDVTHGSPGSGAPSIAAVTVSMDKFATRYAAGVQSNGWRQEMLLAPTIQDVFPRLLRQWLADNKCAPKHVYYFRDGVDEGQFQKVLEHELNEFRRSFRDCNAGSPKFTVIIATKRHHIRFFPKEGDHTSGDKNGNPLPGTLVEHDATHPHHFDFYLCSHVAIQGTARPVHYQVIYDDAKVPADHLQKMIYHQCYQYIRSTTPVSLHPAVYYAHLAAARAKAHENISASAKEHAPAPGKEGFPTSKAVSEVYSNPAKSGDAPPLMPMLGLGISPANVQFINTTMWYI
ncbi:Piwi-domain-containing protein [Xylariaceae sp. AK1471]|nr:Piwi-domain-containing protein [Xylariaceae sp. AK1471]